MPISDWHSPGIILNEQIFVSAFLVVTGFGFLSLVLRFAAFISKRFVSKQALDKLNSLSFDWYKNWGTNTFRLAIWVLAGALAKILVLASGSSLPKLSLFSFDYIYYFILSVALFESRSTMKHRGGNGKLNKII